VHGRLPAGASPVAEVVAFQAIAWPFITLILVILLFWAGLPVGPYQLWVALILSLAASGYIAGGWRVLLTATACLAALTLAGGAALGWLYDFSGDGQWYHLPGILALAQGWNPFQKPLLVNWNADFEHQLTNAAIYVQHYAKGVWIIDAAVYRATGWLEATKVLNLLYIVAAYLLTANFLGRLGLSQLWVHSLALAAAANPVSLYQMGSFFVDGQLASLCTLLVVVSLDYFHRPRKRTLFLLVACVVLLVNVKFTGVVYAAGLGAGLSALAWLRGRRAESGRYAATGITSMLLAVAVVGYQPYITNLLQQGNPFYPAVGRDDAANLATEGQFERWAPAEFLGMGRLEKLVRSVFAESSAAKSLPRWKAPFSIAKHELYIFFNTEPRYGGFGPLFGGILLLVLVVYTLTVGVTRRSNGYLDGALALVVTFSILPNPEAWWARLAPQLWLVPVILASGLAMERVTWLRRASFAVVLLLLVNSLMVGLLNLGRAVEKNLDYREQIAYLQKINIDGPLQIATDPRFSIVTRKRLDAHALSYRLVSEPVCTDPYRFSYPNRPASAQAAACRSLEQ